MRTEKEMMNLITRVAESDSRIRSAFIEGSRANPKATRDIFQDYDICYIVGETESFQRDKTWIDQFGEILYMQYPEDSCYYKSEKSQSYGWLMQFADGNRLDLHVKTKNRAFSELELYRVLVDKDDLMPLKIEDSDAMYWTKMPTKDEFKFTCNEFWWCLNNIAKGLWRKEIPYAMHMLNQVVRPMLYRLLEWRIAEAHDFKISSGKFGKDFKGLLPSDIHARYLKTFPPADIDAMWASVIIMCDLFGDIARELSLRLGYIYNETEAKGSRQFLDAVRVLPKDAGEIFR